MTIYALVIIFVILYFTFIIGLYLFVHNYLLEGMSEEEKEKYYKEMHEYNMKNKFNNKDPFNF